MQETAQNNSLTCNLQIRLFILNTSMQKQMRTRKKRLCSVLSMLSLASITISAQTIFVHVEQEGKPLEQLGAAEFDVSADSQPCVEFVDGKAVMTINGNRVAALPMSSDGALVIEHQNPEIVTNINKVTKSPSAEHPYVTLYSPFQLTVPWGCEAFVPKYDPVDEVLLLNANTQAKPGAIVPPETALVVSGTEAVGFEITAQPPTCTLQSGLTGSSLKIHPSTELTIFTLGVGKNGPNKGKYGFYHFTGKTLNPGLCYLVSNPIGSFVNAVLLSHTTTTGIAPTILNDYRTQNAKYIENGRVMIRKDNKRYYINGQEAK